MSIVIVRSINLKASDKDIILVYLVGLAGLFLTFLTYLFYKSIYQWGTKSRGPFYLTSLLPLGLSGLLLFENIGDVDVDYTIYIVMILVMSGLNIITYFWGLFSK